MDGDGDDGYECKLSRKLFHGNFQESRFSAIATVTLCGWSSRENNYVTVEREREESEGLALDPENARRRCSAHLSNLHCTVQANLLLPFVPLCNAAQLQHWIRLLFIAALGASDGTFMQSAGLTNANPNRISAHTSLRSKAQGSV